MTILADPKWHAHTPILPAGRGTRTMVETVVHDAHPGSYHPFVIHQAYEDNGNWSYAHGHYFFTLEAAMKAFEERTKA
jgi:hypothetical protein